MSTIGITDWDYFHYKGVIPNLECMKLYNYFINHRQLTKFTPFLTPEKYTEFYVRKEYADDNYPPQMFASNCNYSGLAFTSNRYQPLDTAIENTLPDTTIYSNYRKYFGAEREKFKLITGCAHARIDSDILEKSCFHKATVCLHDNDLGSDEKTQLVDRLLHLDQWRQKDIVIGNKFPIEITKDDNLLRWMDVKPNSELFWIVKLGMAADETIVEVLTKQKIKTFKFEYNVCGQAYEENHFLNYEAPHFFLQSLFLRSRGHPTLLIYEPLKMKNPNLQYLIELWNKWLNNNYSSTETFFHFCKRILGYNKAYCTIDRNKTRECFQLIKEKNYELFKMFYERTESDFIGGHIE